MVSKKRIHTSFTLAEKCVLKVENQVSSYQMNLVGENFVTVSEKSVEGSLKDVRALQIKNKWFSMWKLTRMNKCSTISECFFSLSLSTSRYTNEEVNGAIKGENFCFNSHNHVKRDHTSKQAISTMMKSVAMQLLVKLLLMVKSREFRLTVHHTLKSLKKVKLKTTTEYRIQNTKTKIESKFPWSVPSSNSILCIDPQSLLMAIPFARINWFRWTFEGYRKAILTDRKNTNKTHL